ncbi:MAG TPA: SRPBCC family protein [Kribbella sp.]|nr:SRPBCC family protein [Kribbella sp.]
MSENERVVHASPGAVFAVLSDGWTFANWVVGSARIRAVDAGWPEPGCSVHHSVGLWPMLIHDATTAEEYEPSRRLRMKVRAWPAGSGRAEITVVPHPEGCLVTMREEAIEGPAMLIPAAVSEPLLHWRNNETLRRLAYLAERKSEPRSSDH